MRKPDDLLRRVRNRLFRLHGFQPEPILIRHSKIYLMPTGPGWVFGFTLLAMMLASINYALSLGLALTFSLGGVALAGAMRGFRNLLNLEITHGKCAPVFCGTPASFTLILANRRSRPRRLLECASDDAVVRLDHLPGLREEPVNVSVATHVRGWLACPWLEVRTRYPLGLVNVWAFVRPRAMVLVYPRPESHPPPLPASSGNEGQQAQAGSGSEDFFGLRPHRPADSPRHVAWKVVARDGPMVVKQFSGTAGGKLCLDWDALADSLTAEQKISRLAAWVCEAHHSGARWQLTTPEVALGPASGEAHYEACLTALALHGHDNRP